MREIKFRIWTGERMVEPYTNGFLNDVIRKSSNLWLEYTGLKDRNCREIYDGHIVSAYHRIWEQQVTLKVHYLNGCFMFGNYNAHEFFNNHQRIEVIGNVFENEELLEENK